MKATEIQELIDFIAKSGLDEVNIETDSFKLTVKRNNIIVKNEQVAAQNTMAALPMLPKQDADYSAKNNSASNPDNSQTNLAATDTEKKLIPVKSPMIGTFYRSANPDSPVFVNVGDEIKVGQVVGIIEAMKLFNEIESEISGKIVKVLVDNASPVEYDQPLFLVEPNS